MFPPKSDSVWSQLPFSDQKVVPDFIACDPDIVKPDVLKPILVNVTNTLTFTDRILPQSSRCLNENETFPCSYFVDLHNKVKLWETHNYCGARIPLEHNNINVQNFRYSLRKFSYPNIQILQFVEFGFPLGLWSEAYLEPCVKTTHQPILIFPMWTSSLR